MLGGRGQREEGQGRRGREWREMEEERGLRLIFEEVLIYVIEN